MTRSVRNGTVEAASDSFLSLDRELGNYSFHGCVISKSMERKFVCKCGKVFPCLQGLGGHARWCVERHISDEQLEPKEESEKGSEEMRFAETLGFREAAGTSTTNHTNSDGHQSPMAIYQEPNESDLLPTSSLQYRCVKCYALFPSVDDFRRHYLVEHHGSSDSVQEQSVADGKPNSISEKEQDSEPRSFCKRCRGRILSSSEGEDEETNEKPSKKAKEKQETVTSPVPTAGMNRASSNSSINSTKSADSPVKGPTSQKHVGPSGTGLSVEQAKGYDSDSGVLQLPSSAQSPSRAGYSEIMNSLLKDANALSKSYKVIILNFLSGRRVNPDPSKGPIQVIRLGHNVETVRADDGSEKTVVKENYVKLNFDTGEWEKIVKTKQVSSGESSECS